MRDFIFKKTLFEKLQLPYYFPSLQAQAWDSEASLHTVPTLTMTGTLRVTVRASAVGPNDVGGPLRDEGPEGALPDPKEAGPDPLDALGPRETGPAELPKPEGSWLIFSTALNYN